MLKMTKFNKLVGIMQSLPDDVMNRDAFINVPNCNPFLGLVSIVAEDIPSLKKCYKHDEYDNLKWEQALTKYLGIDLSDWAYWNNKLWGNDNGDFLFWDFKYSNVIYSYIAFGKAPIGYLESFKGADELDILYNFHIVNHLVSVRFAWSKLSFRERLDSHLHLRQ